MEGQFGKSGRSGKMGAIPEGISFFFFFCKLQVRVILYDDKVRSKVRMCWRIDQMENK